MLEKGLGFEVWFTASGFGFTGMVSGSGGFGFLIFLVDFFMPESVTCLNSNLFSDVLVNSCHFLMFCSNVFLPEGWFNFAWLPEGWTASSVVCTCGLGLLLVILWGILAWVASGWACFGLKSTSIDLPEGWISLDALPLGWSGGLVVSQVLDVVCGVILFLSGGWAWLEVGVTMSLPAGWKPEWSVGVWVGFLPEGWMLGVGGGSCSFL